MTKCSVFWVQCYKNQKRANAFDWHWVDQHIAAWGDMDETMCVYERLVNYIVSTAHQIELLDWKKPLICTTRQIGLKKVTYIRLRRNASINAISM